MFINTTPHAIRLLCNDQTVLTVESTSDEDIKRLFRCEAVAATMPNLELDGRSVSVTGPATYSLDRELFAEWFARSPSSEPTYVLMSTISAEAWRSSKLEAPANYRFFVPYSGPDPKRCLRVGGEIKWVAELMEFTQCCDGTR